MNSLATHFRNTVQSRSGYRFLVSLSVPEKRIPSIHQPVQNYIVIRKLKCVEQRGRKTTVFSDPVVRRLDN